MVEVLELGPLSGGGDEEERDRRREEKIRGKRDNLHVGPTCKLTVKQHGQTNGLFRSGPDLS